MQDFRGKTAVVTGAASGIGRALAQSFAAEGMRVVLADVEEPALNEAAGALRAAGAEVLAVPTDVAKAADMETLARKTVEAFGEVHIICNNAGVFTGGLSWEASVADYEWVLGVNMWGVIHGIRSFMPLLLEQGGEGHVVNTSSMAGVTTMPYASIYHVSKHAVLALSECLHHELALRGSRIKVSVLCPEVVATHIGASARNRPRELQLDPARSAPSPEREVVEQALVEAIQKGVPPSEMAERVLKAIREERFYILSDDEWRKSCNTRLEDIREGRNPTLSLPGVG